MNLIRQIAQAIIKSERVALFFHQLPDPDTLGSSFGLREILRLNFPHLDVKIVDYDLVRSEQKIPFFQTISSDPVSDDWLATATGIVLDTANTKRIFSQRFAKCSKLICIDHHPQAENFADLSWVDEQYSSTCEMVIQFVLSLKWKVNTIALNCLYFGLLTDTNRFMYPSVRPRTYELMSWMMRNGLDREFVHQNLYLRDWNDVAVDNAIMQEVKITLKGVGYVFLDESWNERFQQKTFSNKIALLAGFKQIQIWTLLYYDQINQRWKGSIRSREYVINDVAAQFNGGGHRLAAGFSLSSPAEFPTVISLLEAKINEN